MAYNRINLLTRIILIQDITLEHTRRGATQKWVYDNIIKPRYCIAQQTYYRYMTINAKAELKKLQDGITDKGNNHEHGKLRIDKTGIVQTKQ